MSKLEVDAIEPQSGTTLTIGASGDTITIPSGATLSSTDPLVFPAGTVSLPAITTTGDTNTGIFFPAADTIGFAEGGVEAMRINSSGNVGIGTSSPIGDLSIVDSTSSSGVEIQPEITTNTNRIANYDRANSNYINFRLDALTQQFYISGSEKMRIDSSGNVMVGGTTAGNAGTISLSVGNAGSTTGGLQLWSTTAATHYVQFGDESGTAANHYRGFMAYNHNVDSLTFGTASTERMRINSSGSLGIGTTSPSAKLSVSGANSDTYGQLNVVSTGAGADAQISFSTPLNGRGIYVDDSATNAFKIYAGAGKGAGGEFVIDNSGNVTINGSLSKSSGSFRIPHPIKPETHELVHSFVEAPQADNIYRGKVELVDGRAEVNIDTVASMTEGTFVALNREVQCFTSNESDWDAVRGSVTGNILTIECQNAESTATISWLVIGERQDQHMYDTDWTDENGKVIVEPLKETEE
jgi:hypothetical protein